MRNAIIVILIIIFGAGASFSAENTSIQVSVDNPDIHIYKGKMGHWTLIESQGSLYYYIQKYKTSLKEVKNINGSNLSNNNGYVFIPYSDAYLKDLETAGVTRKKISSNKNEFIWPLGKVNSISSTFGQRGRRFHTGADMPATRGTPIYAVMDGRVIVTRYDKGLGNNILIEHRDKFFSRYAHNSVNLVKAGDYVRKGQIIGYVGSTGNSTGNHLHFEIRYNEIPLNPLDFLPTKEDLTISDRYRIRKK